MKIKIFTTGGTIDKVYFDDLSEYEVGEPQVVEILKEAKVDFDYELEEITRKDSLNMNGADRAKLKKRLTAEQAELVLITHGTDGMAETAEFINDIQGKVVVLTGSLSPYRFRKSDAAFNVGAAIGALQSLPHGVYIAMSGKVFKAGQVVKNRDAGRFESTE